MKGVKVRMSASFVSLDVSFVQECDLKQCAIIGCALQRRPSGARLGYSSQPNLPHGRYHMMEKLCTVRTRMHVVSGLLGNRFRLQNESNRIIRSNCLGECPAGLKRERSFHFSCSSNDTRPPIGRLRSRIARHDTVGSLLL
jgi:hypothetical protein